MVSDRPIGSQGADRLGVLFPVKKPNVQRTLLGTLSGPLFLIRSLQHCRHCRIWVEYRFLPERQAATRRRLMEENTQRVSMLSVSERT